MSETCPKCGSGRASEEQAWYLCDSCVHQGRFVQSDQCVIREKDTAIAAATKRAEEAEAKIVSMRAGCNSTIENYRKQEHELVKQIAEFERTVTGCRDLIATQRKKLAQAEHCQRDWMESAAAELVKSTAANCKLAAAEQENARLRECLHKCGIELGWLIAHTDTSENGSVVSAYKQAIALLYQPNGGPDA